MGADRLLLVREARGKADIAIVRTLFREYQQQLGVDLCFQGFEAELASLPGAYAAPTGTILLATHLDELVGCVAMRALDERRAEMKRLYVRETARGSGAGLLLVEALVGDAQHRGYTQLVLDTLPSMTAAHRLYERCGFVEIAPYHEAVLAGTRFYARTL